MRKTILPIILLTIFLVLTLIIGCSGGGGTGTGSVNTDWDDLPTPSPAPSGTGYGSIQGTITAKNAEGNLEPVFMALVSVVDTGQSCYTDQYGKYYIYNVPAGERLILVQASGIQESYTVDLEGNQEIAFDIAVGTGATPTPVPTIMPSMTPTPTPTIEMSPSPWPTATEIPVSPTPIFSPSPTPTATQSPSTGSFTAITYGFYEEDEWVGVKSIRIWEYNNYSNRFYRDWGEYSHESSYEATWTSAPLNKYLVVQIEWYNGDGETNDTTYFYTSGQVKYIYHY